MKLASFRAEGPDRIGFALADGALVDVVDALDWQAATPRPGQQPTCPH